MAALATLASVSSMEPRNEKPAGAELDHWYLRTIRRRRRLTRDEADALVITIERAHAAIAEHALASPIGLRAVEAFAGEVARGDRDAASVVCADGAGVPDGTAFLEAAERVRRLAAEMAAERDARARGRRLGPELQGLRLRVEHVDRVVVELGRARVLQQRARERVASLEPAGLTRGSALRSARATLARLEAEAGMTLEALTHAVEVVAVARRQMRVARDTLVEAHLRLVGMVARRFRHRGLELPDLIQEGTIGLMRAVDRFERARRVAFSTYAVWWIRQTIARALANRGRAVRLPINVADDMYVLYRDVQRLQRRLGRDPSLEEIARESGMAIAKVGDLRQIDRGAARTPISLNEPLEGDGETTRLDALADDERPTPADTAVAHALADHARAALAVLKPREREVLTLRFGLGGCGDHTFEEIGAEFGVTRQRILQVTKRALDRLRRSGVAGALRSFYES